MTKKQTDTASTPETDPKDTPLVGESGPEVTEVPPLEEMRLDLERLQGLRERAKTPARREMLDKRISRLRRKIGKVAAAGG